MGESRYPLRRAASPRVQPLWRQYVQDTRRPLYCLLFLFPLVATYEFGALILRPTAWPGRQLVAHSLIQNLLGWLGGSGFWLPAVVLLLTLLIWHVLEGHPWRIHGWVLPLMAIESVVLTAPLFVLGQVMLTTTGTGHIDLREPMVLALGAGVYEEMVFRLYQIAGLTLLLENVLRTPRRISRPLVIIVSAAVFAVCHFVPIGSAPYTWRHFALLVLGGAYLALVFVGRGLGIAAGCHAAKNLIPLLWEWGWS